VVAAPGRDGDEGTAGGSALEMARVAGSAASAKKGERTVLLEVGQLLGITDYFVITSGSNPRQVRTIAEEIEKRMKEAGLGGPLSTEGLDDARWVLLDFGDVVCHVFSDEARDYYDIERLWLDAPRTEID
jgi:ribosome-associated protein